jgi:hypothetical protein
MRQQAETPVIPATEDGVLQEAEFLDAESLITGEVDRAQVARLRKELDRKRLVRRASLLEEQARQCRQEADEIDRVLARVQ